MSNPSMAEKNDVYYMKEALRLALKGRGFVSPNPMVGAVVVKGGEIIGRGFHEAFGELHAEVNALKEAGERAKGATVYVTLEPCNHWGKTPPCTEALIKAGVKRVVIGMRDPNPNVKGGGIGRLKEEGIEVVEGVLEKECKILNRFFIKHVTTGLPYVIAKAAMTLDGKIASRKGYSKWITGEKARRFAHQLRFEVDAICVGIGTVLADDPSLTVRHTSRTKNPIRVVLDKTLKIPEDTFLVRSAKEVPLWIMHGKGVSKKKVVRLQEKGIRLFEISEDGTNLDILEILKVLGKEGINSLLVEGGSEVMGSFFASSSVDEICFFYAPKITGDGMAYPLIKGGRECVTIDEALPVFDLQIKKIGDDIMVRGYLRDVYGNS